MQEVYELQANAVAVRLVQAVPQLQLAELPVPKGPGVGSQKSVLGTQYVPSWVGINGPHGWSDGTVELRLYEEGAFSLSMPNAAGEDGILHRERLLISVAGKPTPTGQSVTTYQGGQFRPGDELVEIYRTTASGAPGKCVFVGAVTKATIDSGKIVIEGSDGLWLLKKTRETAAGFFVNAPRDVCEHYTRVKRVIAADDFPQDGRFQYTGGNAQQTADGQWAYDHAWNNPPSALNGNASTWSPALGTAIRLGAPGLSAAIRTLATFPAYFPQQPDVVVRAQVTFRFAPGITDNDSVVLGFGSPVAGSPASAFPSVAGPWLSVLAGATAQGPPGTAILINSAGQSVILQGQVFVATAWHTLALEVRDRYAFGYLDGQLLGIIPMLGAVENQTGSLYSEASAFFSTGTPRSLVDIDNFVVRATTPGMLRPADPTKLGDYSIGGVPDSGSCLLEVWRADDSPPYGGEFSPSRAASNGVGFTGKFTTPSPALPPVGGISGGSPNIPGWWPGGGGVYGLGRFATRTSGSMYLSLSQYDYRFRYIASAGRLWVGKTRFGEQLLDFWATTVRPVNDPYAITFVSPTLRGLTPALVNSLAAPATSGTNSISLTSGSWGNFSGQLVRIGSAPPYEYAYVDFSATGELRDNLVRSHSAGELVVLMNQGSLAGQPDGWYPFIAEWNFLSGLAHSWASGVLMYERSDQPGWWVNVGAAPYTHAVYDAVGPGNPNGIVGVSYWPFTEGFISHNNSAATVLGIALATTVKAADVASISATQETLVPGDVALLLNGAVATGRSGDYLVTAATGGATLTSFTIAALVQPTSLTGTQTIIKKTGNLGLIFQGTDVWVQLWHAGVMTSLAWNVAAVAGTWYHLVATWDGTNVRLYVNGAQFGVAQSWAHTLDANTNPLYFGATGGTTDYYSGALGHFFAAGGVLGADAVARLYAAASGAPHVPVSESGIVDTAAQPYRFVSHYDQLLQTVKDWGYQITAEPMQLESGEFPARLRPQLRVGRSTEYVVGSPQVKRSTSSEISDAITAEDVADALVADAQGLADPGGAAQVAAEVFNFAGMIGALTPGGPAQALHAWLSEEYDQSNDVAYPGLLFQRLLSLLSLRGAPWEQVSLTSRPERQLVDTFPLIGVPAEFFWLPGDGVRLNFPDLGVVDYSTRQILGTQYAITPGGFGAPAISLRQRPRNFGMVLRDMFRQTLSARRQYQGQLVLSNGNAAGSGYSDAYSRVTLPTNLQNVVSATFVVLSKTDTSPWAIEVNDSTSSAPSFTTVGRYDVSSLVGKLSGAPRMYARAIPGSAQCSYSLELLLRV